MWVKSLGKLLAMLVLAGTVVSVVNAAGIYVSKPAGDEYKNPTLFFKGVTGDQAVSNVVGNDLRLCGWFDPAKNEQDADFIVDGSCSGNALTLNVTKMNNFRVSKQLGADRTHSIHQAVDAILKYQFKVPGICASRIAFSVKTSRLAKNIYISDFDGNNVKVVTHHTSLMVEPDWFPNCRSLVYTMYTTSSTEIVQTELNPYRSRILVSMPGLNAGARISPNGRYMAMILSKDKQVDLYVKPISSSAIMRLTANRAVEASPRWSADGGQLLFVSDITGRPDLYVISAHGGAPAKQPTIGVEAVSPAWAQDGSIAYASKQGGDYCLAIISKNKIVESGLVPKAIGDWDGISWAPDSRHVICSARRERMLYIVDTWTGKKRQFLSGRAGQMSFPSWSPLF